LFICEQAEQNKGAKRERHFWRGKWESREQTESALSANFSLLANYKGKINKICAKIVANYFV